MSVQINTLRAAVAGAFLAFAGAVSAQAASSIEVVDAYFRSATPMSRNGAAFMVIVNHGDAPDRLLAARSDIAARVELHTHVDMGDGVMKMTEVEEGFEIPAHGEHALARGGDHVMFMGLTARPAQGETVAVTLVFETAGEITIDIPADHQRRDAGMGQGQQGHGAAMTGDGDG